MTQPIRIATHLGPFSGCADRYVTGGYRSAAGLGERLRRAAAIPRLEAVELNFRGTVDEASVPHVRDLLAETGLACANISMNLWGEARWALGSLSNPDPSLRREAVALIVAGMQVACELGCPLVSLWPGQDGFDYPFEVDYLRQMDWFVEGVRVCAEAAPEVRLCIEYKPREPRSHLLMDSAARVLWLLDQVDCPNVGVLLDTGHGLEAYENVAQSAALLMRRGCLDLLHFNDNYGDWDWDMIPGTLRIWEMVELIFWLQELDYSGYYSIDIVSPRADPQEALHQSVVNLHRMACLAARLDRAALYLNLCGTNPIANLRLLSDELFAAYDE